MCSDHYYKCVCIVQVQSCEFEYSNNNNNNKIQVLLVSSNICDSVGCRSRLHRFDIRRIGDCIRSPCHTFISASQEWVIINIELCIYNNNNNTRNSNNTHTYVRVHKTQHMRLNRYDREAAQGIIFFKKKTATTSNHFLCDCFCSSAVIGGCTLLRCCCVV